MRVLPRDVDRSCGAGGRCRVCSAATDDSVGPGVCSCARQGLPRGALFGCDRRARAAAHWIRARGNSCESWGSRSVLGPGSVILIRAAGSTSALRLRYRPLRASSLLRGTQTATLTEDSRSMQLARVTVRGRSTDDSTSPVGVERFSSPSSEEQSDDRAGGVLVYLFFQDINY